MWPSKRFLLAYEENIEEGSYDSVDKDWSQILKETSVVDGVRRVQDNGWK